MTQADTQPIRICPNCLAADAYDVEPVSAYEADASTHVIEDSLEMIESLNAYNRWVFDLLKPHVNGRVLEVGCGTGNITKFIARQADAVVGIDPVGRFIQRFKARFAGDEKVTAHQFTLDQMPKPGDPSERFDAAVSCNVFEHIEDHVTALRQVCEQLKPGGKAVIFVPAGPMAFGKLDRALGHYRRYTVRSLRRAMEDAGLEWVEGRYSNMVGLFGWWLNSVLLRRTLVPSDQAKWFNKLVPIFRRFEGWFKPPFGQSVVGVARKPAASALRLTEPVDSATDEPATYRRAA